MNPRRTLATLVATLTIGVAVTSPALAVNADLAGRPDTLHVDGALGYYLWSDEFGLHLRTTGPGPYDVFHATLMTDGRFDDVHLARLEGDDAFDIHPGGHVMEVRFETWSGIDGIDFRIDGGHALRLALRRDGELVPTSEIFLGADASHPAENPFMELR